MCSYLDGFASTFVYEASSSVCDPLFMNPPLPPISHLPMIVLTSLANHPARHYNLDLSPSSTAPHPSDTSRRLTPRNITRAPPHSQIYQPPSPTVIEPRDPSQAPSAPSFSGFKVDSEEPRASSALLDLQSPVP